MDSKSKQRQSVKACYKTNEWSANSGICCNCKWQEDCGKVEESARTKNKA